MAATAAAPPATGATAAEASASEAPSGLFAAVQHLVDQGRAAQADANEAQAFGLAPAKAARARRKSRDLQDQVIARVGPELEKIFKQLDLDGNGTLDAKEVKHALEQAGVAATDTAVKKSIRDLDQNGDGVLSLEEFTQIAWKIQMPR